MRSDYDTYREPVPHSSYWYSKEKVIGDGTYSIVYEGREKIGEYRFDSKPLAVKILNSRASDQFKGWNHKDTANPRADKIAEILKDSDHIVQVKVFSETNTVYLVMLKYNRDLNVLKWYRHQ